MCVHPKQDHQEVTQRNLFETLSNQPEIRLYLPFFVWFRSKRTSVWFQINGKLVNSIWFRVDLTSFRKYFSLCSYFQTFDVHVSYSCSRAKGYRRLLSFWLNLEDKIEELGEENDLLTIGLMSSSRRQGTKSDFEEQSVREGVICLLSSGSVCTVIM